MVPIGTSVTTTTGSEGNIDTDVMTRYELPYDVWPTGNMPS